MVLCTSGESSTCLQSIHYRHIQCNTHCFLLLHQLYFVWLASLLLSRIAGHQGDRRCKPRPALLLYLCSGSYWQLESGTSSRCCRIWVRRHLTHNLNLLTCYIVQYHLCDYAQAGPWAALFLDAPISLTFPFCILVVHRARSILHVAGALWKGGRSCQGNNEFILARKQC